MALITCTECKQPISSRAASCPHCGRPQLYGDNALEAGDWPSAIGWAVGLVVKIVCGIVVFVVVLNAAMSYLGKTW